MPAEASYAAKKIKGPWNKEDTDSRIKYVPTCNAAIATRIIHNQHCLGNFYIFNSHARGGSIRSTLTSSTMAADNNDDIQSPKSTYKRHPRPIRFNLPPLPVEFHRRKKQFYPRCSNPLAGCSHAACSPLSGLIKTPFPMLLFDRQEQ